MIKAGAVLPDKTKVTKNLVGLRTEKQKQKQTTT
jgi:hypothetical protein